MKPRTSRSAQRILRAVVLPALGAFGIAPLVAACERNVFVAPPGSPPAAPDAGTLGAPPPHLFIGSIMPPGVFPPPVGLDVVTPPAPIGAVTAPTAPGIVPPPIIGRVAPSSRDTGAPNSHSLFNRGWEPSQPTVGQMPPAPPGRAAPRPSQKPAANAPKPAEPTSAARADSRRAARMNGGERDPGCAGAGALRRRGPV